MRDIIKSMIGRAESVRMQSNIMGASEYIL
jgi:hypothetical protein